MDSVLEVQTLVRSKKIIFWDFDGVIKESVDIKTKAFISLFSTYGNNVVQNVKLHHEANGGMSRYEKFPIYMKWAGLEPSVQLVASYSKSFNELVFKEVIASDWVSGAEEFLRTNKYDQFFVLVSATPQAELEMIVTELQLKNLFFDIFGAPKTKTSSISEILKKLNVDKKDALMIGDATTDKDAADSNDISFLLRRHQSNVLVFSEYNGLSVNDISGI